MKPHHALDYIFFGLYNVHMHEILGWRMLRVQLHHVEAFKTAGMPIAKIEWLGAVRCKAVCLKTLF